MTHPYSEIPENNEFNEIPENSESLSDQTGRGEMASSLQEFGRLLQKVTTKVYHAGADPEAEGEYIVWQETGCRRVYVSDTGRETIIRIQAELYTTEEFSGILERLLGILEQNDIAFENPVIEYDRETRRYRYLVNCEIL